MSTNDFRLKLDCAQDAVTPRALVQSVTVFAKMLAEAEASDWRISDMELHSVELAATPTTMNEAAERSFATLDAIVRLSVRDGVSRDEVPRFSSILSSLNDLSQETGADVIVSSRNVKGTFTPEGLSDDIKKLLIRGARRSFGHVRGKVDKVILQPRHRAIGLIDRVTQSRVDVKFSSELDNMIPRIHVGMEIDVRGFIRTNNSALLSMDAEALDIIETGHHSPVTAEDLKGILDSGFTGGLSSVDFASALRDAAESDGMTTGENDE